MIERTYGTLLNGAFAGIAARLNAYDDNAARRPAGRRIAVSDTTTNISGDRDTGKPFAHTVEGRDERHIIALDPDERVQVSVHRRPGRVRIVELELDIAGSSYAVLSVAEARALGNALHRIAARAEYENRVLFEKNKEGSDRAA
jgi:hypothetical protein